MSAKFVHYWEWGWMGYLSLYSLVFMPEVGKVSLLEYFVQVNVRLRGIATAAGSHSRSSLVT